MRDAMGGVNGLAPQDQLSILVLSSYLPRIGGGEIQTALQVRTLLQRGHRVQVVDLGGHRQAPRVEVLEGVEVRRVAGPGIPVLEGVVAQARLAMLLLRRLAGTDVVHFNHIGSHLLVARLLCALFRVPLILVIWGSSRSGIGPFGKGWKFRLARWAARGSDRLVALGSETYRNLVEHGFPEDRIVLIANGLDLRRYRPADKGEPIPAGAPLQRPRAIVVGRLVPAKGYDLLISAWAEVSRRHPTAVLAMVGDGPERKKLARMIAEKHLEDRVHLVGARDDVDHWLRWADLYVSSSRTEGMSNALLEALGSGLPVLATKVGGAEDVISDGVEGRLIEPNSAAALERALIVILGDLDRLRAMGHAARRRAETQLSIDAVMDQYQALYHEVVSNSRATSKAS